MDDDSLDELAEWSAGPGGPLPSSPPAVASDAEGSSDGNSRDSEDDTSSEQRDGTDEDEDLEDRSGSEDSDEDDVDGLVTVADAQKRELGADRGLSSDDDAESCPICLNAFRDQAVGTPETCAHWFCLDCIAEWSKNANSCPVDRTIFKFICARTRFGGKIVRKIPVENTGAPAAEEEDPTFCEVCGRSDREDRLLLCDGCDAGYHMECLEPPLQEVPVNEWFCPECAAPGAGPGSDPGHMSAEEVTLLLADVVPTTSRLRPSTGRTRAIARTRQSERVRAAVDRNRVTAARRVQRVPRYLMSSQLDETIEAVVSGLSTAVYQRPATLRAPAKRRRKAGRRRKALGRKKAAPSKSSVRSQSSGTRSKKRQSRRKRRKGKKLKVRDEVTARDRIARTLGLRRPVHGASFPSVYKPADPSLGLMRADIGAASLSLFGDPHELDPFDSGEEPSTNPASPLSAKRRVLSRSALRSHQPVARPISMTLCRRGVPAATAPESEAEAAPVPDLLGSILSGQSLLMMDGADVVIHRDGSLSAKRAAPAAFQRSSLRVSGRAGDCRSGCQQPAVPPSGSPAGDLSGSGPKSSPLISHSGPAPAPTPAPASRLPAHTARPVVRLGPAVASRPGTVQAQSLASNMLGSHRGTQPWSNRDGKCAPPVGSTSPGVSGSDPHPPLRRPIPSLKSAPGRRDISELPRIPKIKRDIGSGHVDSAPAPGPSAEIPSSCISRLTGREGPAQPGHGPRAEGQSSGRGPPEPSAAPGGPQPTAPSSHSSLAPVGAARGKGMGSTFESFRINIPGNTAPAGRLAGPSFCNTFRPVDNKAQRKENPAPLFSLKKPKQLKSEIYDPFDPTGSDSSSAGSSPERPGAALLPSEITRTISVRSPRAPACQTVRCVTTYTVEGASEEAPETSRRPAPSGLRLQDGEAGGSSSDLEPEGLVLSGAAEGEGMPRHSVFFDTKARTVTCVTAMEPSAPPSPDTPPPTTHRIVELHSPSPARSSASSCGQKGAKRGKASTRETRETRSRSRSGSRSRERSSRSASPSASEPHTRKSRPKARAQRSSSEGSSSHDRAKRKKAKDRGREKKRSSWDTRRSRSASPGSSSHERHEGRKKKAQRPSSRSRGREGTPPSSLERSRRHKRRRERSRERSRERPDRKEGASRSRGRRRSRERRAWRSRSPSTEHRAREQRRPHSRERQPRTHSHSPCRKQPAKEASPPPVYDASQPDGGPAPEEVLAALPVVPAAGVAEASVEAPPVPEGPPGSAPDDLDYGDSVEAGHIFDDFPTEAIFIQLDDMSSPPSPESTDSSPERAPLSLPPVPGRARDGDLDPGRALAAIQREVSLIHSDGPQPSLQAESLPEGVPREQDTGVCQAVGTLVAGSEGPQEGEVSQPEEATPQMPLMRTKAAVKRVTWNLQDEGSDTPAADRVPRALPHRLQRPRDTAWDMEDLGLAPFSQAPPFCEMMPPSQAAPELAFPDTDTSQVYSPALPMTLALPPGGPPCMPVSQPAAQFLLQGSLPLVGCGGAQVLTPMPSTLTTTSEPAVLAPVTNSLEEKTSASKPPGEKAKTEEYMKKLHTQERAVEEVKLAIKPFYQRREVTKEEYKDILRKAVQKICHSKSGEINPMKVANLVRAYVEKYRHMRRHRKAGPEEGPPPEAEG